MIIIMLLLLCAGAALEAYFLKNTRTKFKDYSDFFVRDCLPQMVFDIIVAIILLVFSINILGYATVVAGKYLYKLYYMYKYEF